MSSALPDFLGSYRLARFIRSGNSSMIYEGIKDSGSQRVILKILRPQLWGNRAEIAMLKHEYEVAHSIDQSNVIQIYEFARDGKIAYLVLEIFTDLNIKQVYRDEGRNRLLVNFRSIVTQAANALTALHAKGWVHCDVKPDNFLVNPESELKLIDFSISQKITRGKISSVFRRKGQIRGTRSYMSPEQIRNEPLDARSDIYSFGCFLYELLSGKLPFTGSSPNDLLNKHLKAPVPSVQVHNGNVSNPLNELLFRMMAKEPENRLASMEEAGKALTTIRAFKQAPTLEDGMRNDDKS